MTPTGTNGNTAIVQMLQAITEGQGEIAGDLKSLAEKVDLFQKEYIKEHQVVIADARRAHDRLDRAEELLKRHESELAELKKLVQETHLYQRLLVGITSFIGAGLGTWFLAQLLGLMK